MTEWQSIISTAPSQNSYGSCVRSGRKPTEPTSQHYVEAGDTLQGIALKYGTTTEELRRLNKLYYTDSILLRKFLVVPDKKSKPEQSDKPANHKVHAPSKERKPEDNRSPQRRVPDVNGEVNLKKDDTDDAQSFLQKLDMQISAGKKVACTIISDPIFEIPSMQNSTSSRLIRRRSSFERTTATTFSNSDKLLNNDDENLFRL